MPKISWPDRSCVWSHNRNKVGTVLCSRKRQKQKRCYCQCDCGKITEVSSHSLLSGEITRCGHAAHAQIKGAHTDLVGRVFGHLTVLKDDGTRQQRSVMWLCQCDCGKQIHVRGRALLSGATRSCGHVNIQKLIEYNRKLTAKSPGTRAINYGDKPYKNNILQQRNISIAHHGKYTYYRVAVMYKRKQYGHLHHSLEEAIKERDDLKRELWKR